MVPFAEAILDNHGKQYRQAASAVTSSPVGTIPSRGRDFSACGRGHIICGVLAMTGTLRNIGGVQSCREQLNAWNTL